MVCVALYFQVHQPCRLGPYSIFRDDPFYFDDGANSQILRRVAQKCYRPAASLLLDLIERHRGGFRVSLSLSGTVMDQLAAWAPDVLDLFAALARTGHAEFLGETSHHSLAALYWPEEFAEQVCLHSAATAARFGVAPAVFRHTELLHSDALAEMVQRLPRQGGPWSACLAEGVEPLLNERTPARVYTTPAGLPLLLRNHRLSDDVAFRFSSRAWDHGPLNAATYAQWLDRLNSEGDFCGLFMDLETLGEHQWADTGIFTFLEELPAALLSVHAGRNRFVTCSEAALLPSAGVYSAPDITSWADTERDASAWNGNPIQRAALDEYFRIGRVVRERLDRAGEPAERSYCRSLLDDWRKLGTSDHFYYMSTKFFADGEVHKYFNPYDSPYDSYINFMNVLDHLRTRLVREPTERHPSTPPPAFISDPSLRDPFGQTPGTIQR
ncbi:MAG: alpha-amylase [Phycisphaerae bacterium]|nr:alpha-amylase [Phycisphaerae bacterium]